MSIESCPPLHNACRSGLQAGSDALVLEFCKTAEDLAILNQVDALGWTPLQIAAKNGFVKIVRILLQYGASIDLQVDGFRPLYLAAQSGNLEIVKLLCEQGADINSVTANNCTPIYAACHFGHLPIVKYLCERGANIHTKMSTTGFGPVDVALVGFHVEIVSYLLTKGATLIGIS